MKQEPTIIILRSDLGEIKITVPFGTDADGWVDVFKVIMKWLGFGDKTIDNLFFDETKV